MSDFMHRGSSDWMSTVGAGVEPQAYLNLRQAHRQTKVNEAQFRETLSRFEQKRESQATEDLLRKAQSESRQAMMPQVRIRNVSKEYKLVAAVFSPELLRLEENWGKSDPLSAYKNGNVAEASNQASQSYRQKQTTSLKQRPHDHRTQPKRFGSIGGAQTKEMTIA